MKHRNKRNWSQYNQRLKDIARVDFFISQEALDQWHYSGARQAGGKIIYSDHVIELCLILREYFNLGLRQTEGFLSSILPLMGISHSVPNYTTLSRRSETLSVSLKPLMKHPQVRLVVAIDSTGLSLYSHQGWCRTKHQKKTHLPQKRWRKLHVLVDVKSGQILEGCYTKANVNDCTVFPKMMDCLKGQVTAVCGDMAYDTRKCREAIDRHGALQLIPPKHTARTSQENRNLRPYQETFRQRDQAIEFIRYNTIGGQIKRARKSWKEKVGYHARSLVETTMSQIKAHCSDRLTNRKEASRKTQALIKCKIINQIIAV